jgi:hypothetical protein
MDNPTVREQLFAGVPIGQIPSPRPPDYEAHLRRWVEGDQELFEFLETSSFDLDARLEFTREAIQKWQSRLRGRKVACPACRNGAVALEIASGLS